MRRKPKLWNIIKTAQTVQSLHERSKCESKILYKEYDISVCENTEV